MPEGMPEKKFWRCTVCKDVHYGIAGPETCPTCKQVNKYVESDAAEAKTLMGL